MSNLTRYSQDRLSNAEKSVKAPTNHPVGNRCTSPEI